MTDRKLCTVHLRVAALTIAGSLLVTAGVGGCAKFDAALGKQEAVVQFKTGTTTATRLKVRAACSHSLRPGRRRCPPITWPQTTCMT